MSEGPKCRFPESLWVIVCCDTLRLLNGATITHYHKTAKRATAKKFSTALTDWDLFWILEFCKKAVFYES